MIIDQNLERLKAARAYARRLENLAAHPPGYPFFVEDENGDLARIGGPVPFKEERGRAVALVNRLEKGDEKWL